MSKARSWMSALIGVVYLIIAGMVGYYKTFGTIALGTTTAYSLAAILLLYGVFRIWRAMKDLEQLKINQRNEADDIPEGTRGY